MYYIADYDERYRPYDKSGGELKSPDWVKLPAKPKGDGLQELFEQKRGVEVFAVWCLLLEKTTQETKPKNRGKLLNHKEQPATIEEIAKGISLKSKVKLVQHSINVLLAMGWIKSDGQNDKSELTSDALPQTSAKSTILKSTIHKDKEQYLDFVFLSKEEYRKLTERYSKCDVNSLIEDLNIYIGKIGVEAAKKKNKDHYFTILSWARKNGVKTIEKPKPSQKPKEPIKEATVEEKAEIKKRSKALFKLPKNIRRTHTKNTAQQQIKKLGVKP